MRDLPRPAEADDNHSDEAEQDYESSECEEGHPGAVHRVGAALLVGGRLRLTGQQAERGVGAVRCLEEHVRNLLLRLPVQVRPAGSTC